MNLNVIKSAIFVMLLTSAVVFARQAHQHGQVSDRAPDAKMCKMQANAQPASADKSKSGMCCMQGAGQTCCSGNAEPGRSMGCCCQGAAGEGQPGDMATIHSLFDGRQNIVRRFKEVPGGIESWTESNDPQLIAQIQTHLASMRERFEKRQPLHQRDPLFAEIFEHADRIDLKVENTAKGVHVVETSGDPYVAELIRAHARVIDAFIKEGHSEAMKNHAVPAKRN